MKKYLEFVNENLMHLSTDDHDLLERKIWDFFKKHDVKRIEHGYNYILQFEFERILMNNGFSPIETQSKTEHDLISKEYLITIYGTFKNEIINKNKIKLDIENLIKFPILIKIKKVPIVSTGFRDDSIHTSGHFVKYHRHIIEICIPNKNIDQSIRNIINSKTKNAIIYRSFLGKLEDEYSHMYAGYDHDLL